MIKKLYINSENFAVISLKTFFDGVTYLICTSKRVVLEYKLEADKCWRGAYCVDMDEKDINCFLNNL